MSKNFFSVALLLIALVAVMMQVIPDLNENALRGQAIPECNGVCAGDGESTSCMTPAMMLHPAQPGRKNCCSGLYDAQGTCKSDCEVGYGGYMTCHVSSTKTYKYMEEVVTLDCPSGQGLVIDDAYISPDPLYVSSCPSQYVGQQIRCNGACVNNVCNGAQSCVVSASTGWACGDSMGGCKKFLTVTAHCETLPVNNPPGSGLPPTSGTPLTLNCTLRCGDTIRTGNEECDDGNTANNDGCSSTCKTERCGDGITQTNEQCDDGNGVNGDGCENTCIPSGCNSAAECNDRNLCTNDICFGHVCTNPNAVSCMPLVGPMGECKVNECNPGTGLCEEKPKTGTNLTCGAYASDDCRQRYCSGMTCGAEENNRTCSCFSTSFTYMQRITADILTLSMANTRIIASGGACTASETTDCDFANSCGKVHYKNTWSGPDCCDGGGTTDMILTADPGKDYATMNYHDACNGQGTGTRQFPVCPCSASSNSSSSTSSSTSSSSKSSSNSSGSSKSSSNSSGSSKSSSNSSSSGNSSSSSSSSGNSSSSSSSSGNSSSSSSSSGNSSSSSSSSGNSSSSSSTSSSYSSSSSSSIFIDGFSSPFFSSLKISSISSSGGSSVSSFSASSTLFAFSSDGAGSACIEDFQCVNGLCVNGICANTCVNDTQCLNGRCINGACITSNFVAAASLCGNGVLESPEECDDSNRRSGDGCNEACLLEIGICGDGKVQQLLGEQCESSLHGPSLPYGCRNCRFFSTSCGDGKLDPGEECDKGPLNSTSPNADCRPDCSLSRCGDSVLDSTELCDDGNRRAGDGCDSYCRKETTIVASDNTEDSNIQKPNSNNVITNNSTIPFPYAQPHPYPYAQLPFASLQPLLQQVPTTTQSGPAAVVAIGAGAAAGFSWMRRKRK